MLRPKENFESSGPPDGSRCFRGKDRLADEGRKVSGLLFRASDEGYRGHRTLGTSPSPPPFPRGCDAKPPGLPGGFVVPACRFAGT